MFAKYVLAVICCIGLTFIVTPGLRADSQLKVSPSDELLIIDPEVDSQGRPTPIFVDQPSGTQRIEIPPTVILHRYYYTGNRDFQGPMIPGGPTVLVANHPITGEQISLRAQLMPGAPRIRYTKHAILYDYGDRCIALEFGLLACCEPKVIYHRDSGVRRKFDTATGRVGGVISGFVTRTRISEVLRGVEKNKDDAILSLGDRIGDVNTRVSETAQSIVDRTPLGNLGEPRPLSNVQSMLGNVNRSGIVQELEGAVSTNR